MKYFRLLLLPFSLLYGLIVFVRNKLFDLNLKKSVLFDFPVISVGNITVGGTGKTPHVEYLIDLLIENSIIGVLSRGYKRKTKGYILADQGVRPVDIGDEPFQIYRKFPDILVSVCEKRVQGITQLKNDHPEINTILLDDAYQHRYVKPGLSILLIDYNRPVFKDYLLPSGNLRESVSGLKRADIVLVTKVPGSQPKKLEEYWQSKLKLIESQKLFFTTFEYGILLPVFKSKSNENSLQYFKDEGAEVIVVSGIAQPSVFIEYLTGFGLSVQTLIFPDHHNFNDSDITKIQQKFDDCKNGKKIILTTEKDAVRLQHIQNYPEKLKGCTYYLPIKVRFLNNQGKDFDKIVLDYVAKN